MACGVALRRMLVSHVRQTISIGRKCGCCLLQRPFRSIQMSASILQNNRDSPLGFQRKQSTVADSNEEIHKTTLQTESTGKMLAIKWKDGYESKFHSIWLRCNCHCSQCKQTGSGQRMMDVAELDPLVEIKNIQQRESEDIVIEWSDGHDGEISLQFLKSHSYSNGIITSKLPTPESKVPQMEYENLMSSKHGVLRWLKHINNEGMCLLQNVPTVEQQVTKVAELISPIQKTIYGTAFDVVSTPNPINVAYSSAGLDFHMDLIYYESAPGLQFLHCVRFDEGVEGGESLVLDVFHVAEQFRKTHPKEFYTLTKIPATFQKIHYDRESPVHMTYQKPHIFLNHRDEIVSINWAPAFEGPLYVEPEDVQPYYEAYHKFAKAIKNSPAIIELKMKPGDLLVFNNRRILHARKEFRLNGGVRHLQGCYINIDEFKSKVNVLSNELGDKEPVKRVGNQCWF